MKAFACEYITSFLKEAAVALNLHDISCFTPSGLLYSASLQVEGIQVVAVNCNNLMIPSFSYPKVVHVYVIQAKPVLQATHQL